MNLRQLQILHWRGDHIANASPCASPTAIPHAFQIDTCQRRVALLTDPVALERLRAHLPADGVVQTFSGQDAYAFLLRFACGLESRLVAETEIFGQIKQAWRTYELANGSLLGALSPLMQQLFQDTKDIRARFLSGIGSASYGSQVRRLLGDECAGPALLIGAGQLAQSVAPWIECSELWIWNRTRSKAEALAADVQARNPARLCRVLDVDLEAEVAAWQQARDVVICVPADAERDEHRVAAWRARAGQAGRVIHLGGDMRTQSRWAGLPGLTSLDALFDMLRAHSDLRDRQVQRATRGCIEKAMLRSLGGSANQAHGWEDLAAFAALSC